MLPITPRPLTETERALVERLCILNAVPVSSSGDVTRLQVIGRCECGCASVDFIPDEGSSVLGDAFGTTASGIEVGLLLWGRAGMVSGLEVYMLGEETSELPDPQTLRPGHQRPAS